MNRFWIMMFLIGLGIFSGCNGSVQKPCENVILNPKNNSQEIKNIESALNGPGHWQIKSIRFFVESIDDGDHVDVETLIPSKIRDYNGKITALSMIEQKVVCNGIKKGALRTALFSPSLPDVILGKSGMYQGKLRILTPYFEVNSKAANEPNLTYYPVTGSISSQEKNPSTEENIYNMFHRNNSLFGHETKFYRISEKELELRNISKPYSNLKRYLSVVYERVGGAKNKELTSKNSFVNSSSSNPARPSPKDSSEEASIDPDHWEKAKCRDKLKGLMKKRLNESSGHKLMEAPIQIECGGHTYLCMLKEGDEVSHELKASCKPGSVLNFV